MAGDWIKMRTDLYRDPKVSQITDALFDKEGMLAEYVNQHCQRDITVTRNVMRNVTVGALVSVWGVCRHRGKRFGNDLILANTDISVIDDIADLDGFGSAMAEAGWAIQNEKDLLFPRFFEDWNVDPAEELRNKNAERQRRFREKSNVTRNVTGALQSNAREEKSREESNTPLPPKGGDGRHRFSAPTLEQVREYCAERGNSVDAQVWLDHYTSNGWRVGRNPMRDWKAAVRTWERNGVSAQPARAAPPRSNIPDAETTRRILEGGGR